MAQVALVWPVVSYVFIERDQRAETRHFAAWAILNSSTPGDGGRREAIRDLVYDHVDLSFIAFGSVLLSGVNLNSTHIVNATFNGTRVMDSAFQDAELQNWVFRDSAMSNISFNGATIIKSKFEPAEMYNVSFDCSAGNTLFTISLTWCSQTQILNSHFRFYDNMFENNNETSKFRFNKFDNAQIGGSIFCTASKLAARDFCSYGENESIRHDYDGINTAQLLANIADKKLTLAALANSTFL